MFDQLLDLIAKLQKEDEYLTPSQAQELVANAELKGSYREMLILGKLLEAVSKELTSSEVQNKAYNEARLEGIKSKHEFMGNNLTLKTKNEYEYPENDYINKCEVEMEEKEKQIQPVLDEIKGLKDSIKSKQKELVKNGEAEIKETKKQMVVNK